VPYKPIFFNIGETQYRIDPHAVQRMHERNVSLEDIIEAIKNGDKKPSSVSKYKIEYHSVYTPYTNPLKLVVVVRSKGNKNVIKTVRPGKLEN